MNGQQQSEGLLLVTTETKIASHRAQPSVQACTVAMAPVSFNDRVLASVQHTGNEQAASSKEDQLCYLHCVIPKLATAGN